MDEAMAASTRQIGQTIRVARNALGTTQRQLALAAGTGLRFIIDLERGKETCELGKTLDVLAALGVRVTLEGPDEASAVPDEASAVPDGS